MPCNPTIRFGEPEAGSCVSNELVEYLNTKTEVLVDCDPADTSGVYFGPNPPQDTSVIWYRTTASNQPMYMLVFVDGVWRRVSAAPIGMKAYYNGPISGVFNPITGQGIPGGEWDGWIIRHSDDNKFVIMAENFTAAEWKTSVTGAPLHTGGDATVTSDGTNTYRPPRNPVIVGHCNADGNDNVTAWNGVLYGTVGTAGQTTLLPADAGNTTPTATPNIPPFVAYVLVEYEGYL